MRVTSWTGQYRDKETVGCVRIGLEGLRRITEFQVSLG